VQYRHTDTIILLLLSTLETVQMRSRKPLKLIVDYRSCSRKIDTIRSFSGLNGRLKYLKQ